MSGDTSLVFNLIARDDGLTRKLAETKNEVRATGDAAGFAAAKWTLWGTGAAIAVGQAVALASALSQVGGVVLALPSIATTAAASIGGLSLSMIGLGAALKTSSGGAGGAAFDYAAAEHRVASALRTSLDAQVSLDRARQEATRNIDDLARSLRGAALDEEGAAMAVKRAEADLRKAKRGGNRQDIAAADLAYRQSLQTLDDARQRTKDLGAEQADAAKKGVEGSDSVQAALQRQAEATYELAQAQAALKKGASGGGGGKDPAAEAFAKLAPAARDLVTVIKRITPAWTAMQQAVQQEVWAGVAGDLSRLSTTYLPVATTQLKRFGGAWNVAIRETAGLLSTPEAVRAVNVMLSEGADAVHLLARAVRPLVSAFLDIGSAGAHILPMLASDVLHLAERFERWIRAAKQSGQLAEWAGRSVVIIRQLAAIAWNLTSAIVAIFRAGGVAEGESFLTWLTTATANMAAFMNSAKGQEWLSTFFESLRTTATVAAEAVTTLSVSGSDLSATFSVTGAVMKFVADHLDTFISLLPVIAAGFVAMKIAQSAGNIASVIGIPLKIAELFIYRMMTSAIRAHTVALGANTTAMTVGAGVTTASGVAAEGASVGFWSLAAALLANPITWIVLAIIALIAIIVIIATKTDWFQRLWKWAWGGIKEGAQAVWHWIKDDLWPGLVSFWMGAIQIPAEQALNYVVSSFNWFIDTLTSVRNRVRGAVNGIWDFLVAQTKGAINMIIGLWNRLDFAIHIRVPDWVPLYGGRSFDVDDFIPDIPMLATGGRIKTEGLAFLHPNEEVMPAAEVRRRDEGQASGGRAVRFTGNTDSAFATAFQKLVRSGLIIIE